MGMDSQLEACGQFVDNYKCGGILKFSFERENNGRFKPLNIKCWYETGYGFIYLRICLIDFYKTYIYELSYYTKEMDDPDSAEYEITFNLNNAINKINPSKDCDKVNVCIFTCYCPDKICECEVHPEYADYDIKKITVLSPEKKPISEDEKPEKEIVSYLSLKNISKLFSNLSLIFLFKSILHFLRIYQFCNLIHSYIKRNIAMESILYACGKQVDNYNCRGKLEFSFKRYWNGKFNPIDIECDYKTGYGTIYLRICLIDFKKLYIYKLNYYIEKLDNPDYAEFEITFDLNDAVDKIDASKNCDKVNVCIFTCLCLDKNCKCKFDYEYSDYDIEKITVIYPTNETKPAIKETKPTPDYLEELQELSNHIPTIVESCDEITSKLNNAVTKIVEHKKILLALSKELKRMCEE